MTDILVMLLLLGGAWVFIRIMLKEPIIPGKAKKTKKGDNQNVIKQPSKSQIAKISKVQAEREALLEKEAELFEELFDDVVGIEDHMLRLVDNEFLMFAEVEPVNYYLRDYDEQEIVDTAMDTWHATLNYDVRIYLQNRYIDLTEQIELIRKDNQEADDLNEESRSFGENMLEGLRQWQSSQPRFETKRYIILNYKVDVKDLRLDPEDDVEERILEKAFNELIRRVQSTRQHLRRGEMNVQMLSGDGITEVAYYAFNRKKALKVPYRNIEKNEMLSLYVTSDWTEDQVIRRKNSAEFALLDTKEYKPSEYVDISKDNSEQGLLQN